MKPPFPIPPRREDDREKWADYWQASIEQGSPMIVTPKGCFRMGKEERQPVGLWVVLSVLVLGLVCIAAIAGCKHVEAEKAKQPCPCCKECCEQ